MPQNERPGSPDLAWGTTPSSAEPPLIRDALHRLHAGEEAAVHELRRLTCGDGHTRAFGAAVVPALLAFVESGRSPLRGDILQLVGDLACADSARFPRRGHVLRRTEATIIFDGWGDVVNRAVEEVRRTLGRHADRLTAFLEDHDPAVRSAAAYVVAAALPPRSAITGAVRAGLDVEGDTVVQMSLVLAVAQHDLERGRADEAAAWASTLWPELSAPAGVRVGGALAWFDLTTEPAPPALRILLGDLPPPVTVRMLEQLPWIQHASRTWWRDLTAGNHAPSYQGPEPF
ncbi:hypothetical protein [Actinoplanes awajinensis]|uniref:Uncharacterized protein n=1 Tax=Actinoplanes awajinensis subsp. mycoplanecinus TaxID=135947 RepID=A0A101JT72_9ACTN|nr:hypothetical protein [Actinoplanes awajinensis]KUL32630.1 hypothetical protein ADL15_19115 [Actinoplanes awajinensis subsp. mycoplanecinus]